MKKTKPEFNPNTISLTGAQGVMQLAPPTRNLLILIIHFYTRSNTLEGAKYISEKRNQYNEYIKLALAAYNTGSRNVAKYGGVPPFKETVCLSGVGVKSKVKVVKF